MPVKKVAPKKSTAKSSDEVSTHVVVEHFNNKTKERDVIKESKRNEDTNPKNNAINMLPEGRTLLGISKGVTVNMGNFNSARIDCWIVRNIPDDDQTIMDEYAKAGALIDEQLEYEQGELTIEDDK